MRRRIEGIAGAAGAVLADVFRALGSASFDWADVVTNGAAVLVGVALAEILWRLRVSRSFARGGYRSVGGRFAERTARSTKAQGGGL